MQDDKINTEGDENTPESSSSREGSNNISPPIKEAFVASSGEAATAKVKHPYLMLEEIEPQNNNPTEPITKSHFFEIHTEALKNKFPPLDQDTQKQNYQKYNLENNSEKNTYFGKLLLMIAITSCVVILFSSIISKVRQERYRMLEEKKMLERQAAQMETDSSKLENEYSALKNDPVRIEKEAREQFGFIRPDEILYTKYNFRIKSTTKKEPVKEVSQNRWKVFFFEGPFRWQLPALIILLATAFYIISYHYEYRKLHKSNR